MLKRLTNSPSRLVPFPTTSETPSDTAARTPAAVLRITNIAATRKLNGARGAFFAIARAFIKPSAFALTLTPTVVLTS